MNAVEQNIKPITELCKKHNVKQIFIFGSILTKRFSPKSDIDFLVQFDDINPLYYFDNYMGLKEGLELLLNRQADLVENQAIKNPVLRKIIDREKVLIYERKNIEVPV